MGGGGGGGPPAYFVSEFFVLNMTLLYFQLTHTVACNIQKNIVENYLL